MVGKDIEETELITDLTEISIQDGDDSNEYAYFVDKKRRVDFIMEFINAEGEDDDVKRQTYCKNLEEEGLHLETVVMTPLKTNAYGTFEEEDSDDKVTFIKLHAPFEVLSKYALKTKMKFPVEHNIDDIKDSWHESSIYKFFTKIDPFVIKNPQFQKPKSYLVDHFDDNNIERFVHASTKDDFFTTSERSRLVYFILARTKFGEGELDFGIHQLKYEKVFVDVYPLHSGLLRRDKDKEPTNERQKLQVDWASNKRLFKYQPIEAIRSYFGEKIALYYAWLGFYTSFLVPAAILGIVCFIYGVVTSYTDGPIKELCESAKNNNSNNTNLFYMCPACDGSCSYYLLQIQGCRYAKITRFFDNEATLFFAIFMSLWATIFLEFWKRKQLTLAYDWHAMDFEEEEERPRPEYSIKTTEVRINPVTKQQEPWMTDRQRRVRFVGAASTVCFFIVLILAAVISVIVFRATLTHFLNQQTNPKLRSNSKIIVSVSAATLNLICINILKIVYEKVAERLTDWENPRTRTDYEDSFIVKMFWFQFANTYASIFYVAFFKSADIVGTPGNHKTFGKGIRIAGCSAQGCFLELAIQLIIIMVGQQIIGNIKEIVIPFVTKMFQQRKARKTYGSKAAAKQQDEELPQWIADHACKENEKRNLFNQYLEIVLQYGFVTMFVAAFPLAPFFALFNNLIEIRLDAINFINFSRRPVAQRAEDIGAWYGILSTITMFSTVVNAFVLAFTSEWIPRITYKYYFSQDGSLSGFTNHSLSYFNVNDFKKHERPLNATLNGLAPQPYCRYPGYYEPHNPYDHNKDYWVIMTARLTFIICFQAFVMTITWVVAYIIPDIPESLDLKMQREEYLSKQNKKQS